MAEYDYGQAKIAEFGRQVDAGLVKYDKGTAEEVVRLFQNVIDELIRKQFEGRELHTVSGMGGFPSLQELEAGFSNKGVEFTQVQGLFIAGAMQMQRHFLKASGDLEGAEERNRASVRAFEAATALNK